MHKTLYNISRGTIALKTFHFFEGALVPWHNGTMASPSLGATTCTKTLWKFKVTS